MLANGTKLKDTRDMTGMRIL